MYRALPINKSRSTQYSGPHSRPSLLRAVVAKHEELVGLQRKLDRPFARMTADEFRDVSGEIRIHVVRDELAAGVFPNGDIVDVAEDAQVADFHSCADRGHADGRQIGVGRFRVAEVRVSRWGVEGNHAPVDPQVQLVVAVREKQVVSACAANVGQCRRPELLHVGAADRRASRGPRPSRYGIEIVGRPCAVRAPVRRCRFPRRRCIPTPNLQPSEDRGHRARAPGCCWQPRGSAGVVGREIGDPLGFHSPGRIGVWYLTIFH